MVAIRVISHGARYSPASLGAVSVTFSPSAPLLSVVSSDNLRASSKAVALESDIDTDLSSFVAQITSDSSGGIGTSSYDSITGISLSSTLKKDGDFVVLLGTITFNMTVDAPGLYTTAQPPVLTTPAGTVINCTLTWLTLTQHILQA